MALIGEMKYLTIGDSTYSVPSSGGGGGGTVTSVQVQATSPVQSSNSSAQSAVLNTTISLANGYGDTKNPYASKSKNQVLATPTNASGAPSFRALDASDIPDLSDDYLPADTSIPTKVSDLDNDSGFLSYAVTSFATQEGTHTPQTQAITGDVTISVPTKTSHLYNDSGFITGYTETDPTVPSWAKASSKPSYTASEVGAVPTSRTVNGKALSSNITLSASDVSALPASTSIPSKTSDLTNDSGFITGYTETDPTVPSWAKASTKPSYTASEVGAVSKTNGYATDSEILDATTISVWQGILGIS